MVNGGGLVYGGTLKVVNVGGTLNGGEVFTLFSPAGTGSFATTDLPALGTGLNWWLGTLNGNGCLVVNRKPTGVADHGYTRAKGTGLRIAKADLMAGVSDPDSGDSASLGGLVSITSAQGATVTEDATYYHYAPVNDNNDTLQFIVVDARGAAVTNNITINVTASIGSVQHITPPAGGSAAVNFAGIENYTYSIQRSTNLKDWVTVATTNAPAGGLFQWVDSFSDLGSVPPQAFYRLQAPVAP